MCACGRLSTPTRVRCARHVHLDLTARRTNSFSALQHRSAARSRLNSDLKTEYNNNRDWFHKNEKHIYTFVLGLYAVCFAASVVAVVLLVALNGPPKKAVRYRAAAWCSLLARATSAALWREDG